MSRFHAMTVILALLATPLALLVRGIVCDPAECACKTICTGQLSISAAQAKQLCGFTKHAPICGTHQTHHALDYGFVTPIAPTIVSAHPAVPGPGISGAMALLSSPYPVEGFASAPFEPPRA